MFTFPFTCKVPPPVTPEAVFTKTVLEVVIVINLVTLPLGQKYILPFPVPPSANNVIP